MNGAVSVAEHVTSVVPNVKVEPEAGVHVGVMSPSTLSKAVDTNITTSPTGLVASIIISAGTVITGASVSSKTSKNKIGQPKKN